MTAQIEYSFAYDPRSTLEAMRLSGARIYKGSAKLLWFASLVTNSVLIPLGAAALFAVVAKLGFGRLPNGSLWIPAAGLLGGVFGVWVNSATQKQLARLTTRSEFACSGRIVFDEGGVTLYIKASEWRTGWPDVDDVLLGKLSIAVCIAGIVLILPLSAFAGRADMQSEFVKIENLRKQAHTAS